MADLTTLPFIPQNIAQQVSQSRQSSSNMGLLSALPVVGGLADAIFGNKSRARQQRLAEKRQHAYNMELANYNFDKNLEM